MKVLVKWKWSTFCSLAVIMLLGIFLTGRTSYEETSKLGKTMISDDAAVTYLKKLDISFQTPKNYTRSFLDTSDSEKNSLLYLYDMQFCAMPIAGDYAVELYLLENKGTGDTVELTLSDSREAIPQKADWLGINSLNEADEEQKAMLCSYIEQFLMNQSDYTPTSELDMEYITLGDSLYLRTAYTRKGTVWTEYNVVLDYITVINGYLIEFTDYYMSNTEPDAANKFEYLHNTFDELQAGLTEGNTTTNAGMTDSSESFLSKLLSFTFSLSFLVIPLVYLLLCNITCAKKPQWHEDVLSLERSKELLGYFALLIVIHHLAQKLGGEAGMLTVLEDFGVGLVAGFFFFSGYGLFLSYRQKPGYLKGFFKKRYPAILVPFYLCTSIFIVVTICKAGLPKAGTFFSWITGWILINDHMWYIVEIALFYAIFYLCFRFIKNETAALAIMALFLIAFTGGCLLLGHGEHWFQGEWWYNTSLVFWMGMVFAKWKDSILKSFRKYYPLWLTGVGAAFTALYFATKYMLKTYSYWSETPADPGYLDKLRCLGVQLPMVITFMLLVVLVGMKIKTGNRAMSFLGKISLELYLIHNLFLKNLLMISGTAMYTLSVITASVIAAALLHELDVWLICKLTHKPLPKRKKIQWHLKEHIAGLRLKASLLMKYIRRHPGRSVRYVGRNIVCLFLCAISILPIYILYVNATRTSTSITQGISFLPMGQFAANLKSFKDTISVFDTNIYMAIFHSCLISLCFCLLASYFGAMCAYGFEIYKFKGKKWLWNIIIVSLMMSPVAGFLGFYDLVSRLHLLNTYLPIIIPGIATPSTAFFMRMYLKTLHLNEIVEAARIDGCSELGIFNRIALPAIKPAFLLQIIFTFVTSWNNTFYQSMIIHEPKKRTISLFLHIFAGDQGAGSNPVIYVILLLTTLPPMIVYILCVKGVMSRIVLGAVKE